MKATAIADFADRLYALTDDLLFLQKDIEELHSLIEQAGISTEKLHAWRYIFQNADYNEMVRAISCLPPDILARSFGVDKSEN
jgi:hypothetical protein